VLNKQKKQLDELNERRIQLEMMMDWRNQLKSIDCDISRIAIDAFNDLLPASSLNDVGEKFIKDALKKFSLNEVLDAIEISARYIKFESDGITDGGSVTTALKRIGGICANKRQPEHKQAISYIVGICRNRFSYCKDYVLRQRLENAYNAGITIDDMKEAALDCRNWSQYTQWIESSMEAING